MQHIPEDTMDMPEVLRSLNIVNSVIENMAPLHSFRVCRVLFIENSNITINLNHLSRLLHLKYLGISYTPIDELPKEIGHLKSLLALILVETGLDELPSAFCSLTQLLSLTTAGFKRLPADRMWKLTSLEELQLNVVGQSATEDLVVELGKLTRLRVVAITFIEELVESLQKPLVRSLCSLGELQELIVDSKGSQLGATIWESWEPPRKLQRLLINGIEFSRLPGWINSSRLPHLRFISLKVHVVEVQDLDNLARLPELSYLKLGGYSWPPGYTVGIDGFKNLRLCHVSTALKFHTGAMPRLKELQFTVYAGLGCFDVNGVAFKQLPTKDVIGDLDFSLDNLLSLEQVTVKIDCIDATATEVQEVEAVVSRVVEDHPNHPTIKVDRIYEEVMCDVDNVNATLDIGVLMWKDESDANFIRLLLPYRRIQEAIFVINCAGASTCEVEKVEEALIRAAVIHPNHPTIQLIKKNTEGILSSPDHSDTENQSCNLANPSVDNKQRVTMQTLADAAAKMDFPICASLGAMAPFLKKLHSHMALILEEEVDNEVKLLLQGATKINRFLMMLSEAEDIPWVAKHWMKEARELSYDMEDYIDQVMQPGTGVYTKAVATRRSNSLIKISRLQKAKLKCRSPMATKIVEFRARVEETCKNYESYGLGSLNFESQLVSYNHRLPTGRVDLSHDHLIDHGVTGELINCQDSDGDKNQIENQLVSHGTRSLSSHVELILLTDHGPMDELFNCLAIDDNKHQVKVVSIVGPSGVGKTTLAKRLYQKLKGRFQFRAFVRASSHPDMRRILTSIFVQIQKQQPLKHWDANDLIDNIAEHLKNKRYLVVVDDLWSSSVWDLISRAFQKGGCFGRVITTTQIGDVALTCCRYHSEYIFPMRPLDDEQSRKLFFYMVCGHEDACPQQFREVSYEIITNCGGLPLSIINMARLLACEPLEYWQHIKRSLCFSSWKSPSSIPGHQMEESFPDSTSGELKKVLNLVYNNLAPVLKTCLLYFNMYPADYTIQKDDLVKQWVAEGFLGAVEGEDREEMARCYFDELVSRGMIQPICTDCNGMALSCTVNHMILDLIACKSMEDNFITIVDFFQRGIGLADMVRRLSVQFGGAKCANVPGGIRMTQVRSLIFFGFFKCVPSIVKYKLLRVLILHVWADQDNPSLDLTRICELILLRYLKVGCNITIKLPEEMHELKFLETLEVDARLDAVPMDIVRLQRLVHLRLPKGIALPHGMDRMISLRTLGYLDLSCNPEEHVLNLGQLTNLQDLYLTCAMVPSNHLVRNMKCVSLILGRLSHLRSMTLIPDSSHGSTSEASLSSMSTVCDGFSNVPSPPVLLERLELFRRICIFSSLPRWIAELRKLCILKIAARELRQYDINVLKGLNALSALSLYISAAPEERIVIDEEGFIILRHFKIICSALCLAFVKGAMPSVRRLKLGFDANRTVQYSPIDAGFEHLACLDEISAKIGISGVDESSRMAAKTELEAAVNKHPRTPVLNVQLVDWNFQGEQERCVVPQAQGDSNKKN